ncbi:penicillin acylase family protein [Allokutzneria oryzae]|uniref:Penicillin acylase family protein n=1 Tax=Allokutzneria oryzae TaxID=1378989 RepID=A0ABV5ZQH5_9PSEU
MRSGSALSRIKVTKREKPGHAGWLTRIRGRGGPGRGGGAPARGIGTTCRTGSRGFRSATRICACPNTSTLMAYSQSANPASPHHSDQTKLYSRKQWVTERFCEKDILASPSLRVIRL